MTELSKEKGFPNKSEKSSPLSKPTKPARSSNTPTTHRSGTLVRKRAAVPQVGPLLLDACNLAGRGEEHRVPGAIRGGPGQ